jgi:hypothetical protein
MKLIVDEDVAKVLEFMQHGAHISAKKLQNVAQGVANVDRLIWPPEWQEKPDNVIFPFTVELRPFTLSQRSDASQQRLESTSLLQADHHTIPVHVESNADAPEAKKEP